jgi:flagellar biosynthesis GTPase FlhF
MKLKSYFSGTVEAAMDLARQELGEEALLVNARPATPETRYLGAYEVVFGLPQGVARPASRAPVASPSQATPSNDEPPSVDRLAGEITGLKREFERMMQSFLETQQAKPATRQAEHAERVEHPAGVQLCTVDATLGRSGAARAVVVLVGPPGAGKTTTLIKLAARYGLSAGKPAQILSADVQRIAAADQLRSLASILGIGCDIAETPGALAQMLEEHRSKDLVFVDTPGLARGEMVDAADLAGLIASLPDVDTHLVLPAFMRSADLTCAIEQYAAFRPRKLLFTRMDETTCHHAPLKIAARHALPISFLGTGQQIPDDLEPADLGRLEQLLRGIPAGAGQTKTTRQNQVYGHAKKAAA